MNSRQVVSVLMLLVIGATCIPKASGGESGLAENAALQYWKAFALVPQLSDEQHDAVHKALEQGTIDRSLRKVIASSESALHELRKGAALKECSWAISLDEGIHTQLPHLGKARELSRVACLRAEASFQRGKASDATEDIVAVMTLGRHIGEDGLLIMLLIDYAIERMAIQMTAANLPSLDTDELQTVSRKLKALPPQVTVSEAITTEKEAYVSSIIRILSRPDGKQRLITLFGGPESDDAKEIQKHSREELVAAAKELLGFYDRLAEAVALSPDETKQAQEQLMANPGIEGPARQMALGLIPAIGKARREEATHQTRLALLTAAIAVQQHGPDVLKENTYHDPFGTGPLKYTKTASGFTLQAALTDRQGQPVTLSVGRP